MVKQSLAVLLSVLVLAPSLAVAQQSKAGVVTTLEGNVTARRIALTSPVPLKFKDDVFLQDTVTTGDQSLARMLLGGKAVVTVRERSVLTITEVPGKSTLEIESGKFSLAVAREKMKPGEEIVIRTPNAIAGVRGTVVVTEVNRQSAQARGGVPAVLTNFYVLRGSIMAQPLDPGTRQPMGTPLQVGTLQAYSGAGSAAPRVAPVPAEQVGQITSGLQPSGPKGGGEAGQEQVKAQAVETAVTLLGALNGGGNGTPGNGHQTELALAPPPPPPAPAETREVAPIVALASDIEEAQKLAAEGLVLKEFSDFLSALGINVTLTDTPAVRFSTGFTSSSTSPLISLTDATVLQVGDASLIELLSGADVSLAGPLASITNSTLITADNAMEMEGGRLRTTSNHPLFVLAGSTVHPNGNFLRMVRAASLDLAGPLLTATGGTFTSGLSDDLKALITVLDGSVINSIATSALIAMTDSTVDTQGPVVSLRRSASTSSQSKITLAGPLFSGNNVSINTTSLGFGSTFGTSNNCCSTFAVEQGAVLSSTTTSALVSLTDSTVRIQDSQSGANFFLLADTVTGFPASELVASATVSLAGPLLRASNSTITPLFSLLSVQRSRFTSSAENALIELFSSTVNAGGLDLNGNATFGRLLTLISGLSPFASAATSASIALSGPLLFASGSTLNATQLMAILGGAAFSSTTTSALISLSGTSLRLTTAVVGATTNHGNIVDIGGVGGPDGASFATMSLQGPLLSVGNGSTLSLSGALALVFAGGQIVESHPTASFAFISGGTHSIGSDSGNALFRLFGRTSANTTEVVSTPGLSTTTSSLTLGTDEPIRRSGSGAFLETSSATITTKAALTLDNALLSATAPLIAMRNSSLTSAGDALNLTSKAKLTATGPLVKLDGSTLAVTTGHAIRVMNGSFLNITGDLVSIFNGGHLNISNGAALFVSGGSVVKISGGLVNFHNSAGQITVANNICSGTCSTAGGVNFFLQNGATPSNLSVSGAFKNDGSATKTVGLSDAVIILDGATSKVIISGN